jgi:hypothetical protein
MCDLCNFVHKYKGYNVGDINRVELVYLRKHIVQ